MSTDTMSMTETEILEQIKRETSENRVFLYMKGTPDMPRCGFSNQVVQILGRGADFRREQVADFIVEEVSLLLADIQQFLHFVVFFLKAAQSFFHGGRGGAFFDGFRASSVFGGLRFLMIAFSFVHAFIH